MRKYLLSVLCALLTVAAVPQVAHASLVDSLNLAPLVPIVLDAPVELISAQGTIGPNDGKRDIHLHCVMCDANGHFVAGHMLPGCIVCATVEVTILVASEGSIERSYDPVSQFSIFRYNTSSKSGR